MRQLPAPIVFSVKHRRPACALLQAALGGSVALATRFPEETWLIDGGSDIDFDINRDLKVYSIADEAQLEQLIMIATITVQARETLMREWAQDVICELLTTHGPLLARDLIARSGGRLGSSTYVHLLMMEEAGRVRAEVATVENEVTLFRYYLTDAGVKYMEARRGVNSVPGKLSPA
jgi:hypothetical protein